MIDAKEKRRYMLEQRIRVPGHRKEVSGTAAGTLERVATPNLPKAEAG